MPLKDPLDYRLTRIKTEAATGYFDCAPAEAVNFDTALAWCRSHPNDEFMRKHLLRIITAWDAKTLQEQILSADADDLFLKALYFEASLLVAPFAHLRKHFSEKLQRRLSQATPLVFIKAHLRKDHRLHRRWIERLRPNFFEHRTLPTPDEIGLAAPVDDPAVDRAMAAPSPLAHLAGTFPPESERAPDEPVAPETLSAMALERLSHAGVQVGPEMRHESSLSPIALLRNWQVSIDVDCDRHRYRLTGEQTSFGRGIDLESARIACIMEVVERVSSYAFIQGKEVKGYQHPYPLTHAPLSALNKKGISALDPNRLGLEAPYRDEPLYWIEGMGIDERESVLVPIQAVFLFCNLDEVKLFSALGSTGLGAGATLAQAKCKALQEIIERDSASVVPYTESLRFDVETSDERIARLLQAYAERGVHVGFLDITGPLGLPCCKAFVQDIDGTIAAGSGAHLDARQALISALTETPYPFPNSEPSHPLPPAAVRVPLEDLPDYDRGSHEENLELLEQLLLCNGLAPIYVNLTREDLQLPVVRAFVPGMEMLGDFDTFSRVHPRLYGYYMKYATAA